MTKYEQLQAMIKDYGEAAFENMCACKALAEDILKTFPVYVGVEARQVTMVPAAGEFDPRKVYGEAAYSFFGRQAITLDPVAFGVCLTVPNEDNKDSLWLRARIVADVSGSEFEVFVGHQPKINILRNHGGDLSRIHDAIYKEFLDTFKKEVDDFRDDRVRNGFGFVAG